MKSITVSILTYNSSKTIRACLDSLVTQTDPGFSVHIIDDASTDDTLKIVRDYRASLAITVYKNGTHNIPHGRNIALEKVKKGICAFVDSDDTVSTDWVATIRHTFATQPDLAMISGKQTTSYRTKFAQAIAANDDTMRSLFGGGILQFCTCNSAINRDVLTDTYFNEAFVNGEDIEFAARVERTHAWEFIENLEVFHSTRDTIPGYGKQTYLYGTWKLYFSYATRAFRPVDAVPLAYGLFSIALACLYPPAIVMIFLLPIAQTGVTIVTQRLSLRLWHLSFLAWCIKNTYWSIGICIGLAKLASRPSFRQTLRAELAS